MRPRPLAGRWGCALAIGLAALLSSGASAAPCADDDFAGTLGCSSGDVVLSELSVTSIVDGCDYIGDTANLTVRAQITTIAATRYDIGIYLAVDGGHALVGACHHDYLPAPPFFSAESAGDVCGDTTSIASPVLADLGSPITIPCTDADQDGAAEVRGLLSWDNNASNGTSVPHCLGLADAIPHSAIRCSPSGLHNIVGLPVPTQSIEVRKEVVDGDPADQFALQIDGETHAITTQFGTTGPIPVSGAVSHTVAELAGDEETDLADYDSAIECLDLVGTCTDDLITRCVADAMCTTGVCDLGPFLVASCSDCTSLNVAVPNAQSTIQCTITNSPEPGRLAMLVAGAASVWLLARRRRPVRGS